MQDQVALGESRSPPSVKGGIARAPGSLSRWGWSVQLMEMAGFDVDLLAQQSLSSSACMRTPAWFLQKV